ncbi:MAG: hypothetical protein COU31_04425 [Candidatus Magasanikbacteria bacterium CG10_big_fil_rev_8_21_14_0_10_40_10]|uniref:Sortilin N-terminal domain-containing protein n=1 Tax=Candidatus Magasanikbacteria bacterium CG10_big_fil_rev_8_21_14_0_10_40_10 TaxID=1974648 RepID=A0A2M6W313_9BACT|nr:MAG: hypothetical protein COU31_04425 [Candidatus Magasanikbacteria bacterium CG10_big_fil_rev_8_21_14_0_10_40_10]
MGFKTKSLLASLVAVLVLSGASCLSLSGQSQGIVGMFRTDNKGDAWKAIAAYPTLQGVKSLAGLNVFRLYFDPSDPNAIYLATRGQGLYYSYDNGESWDFVDGLGNFYAYGLVVDPQDKCTIYVSDGPHIYKTEDCLRSWKLIFTEERSSERFVGLAVDYKNSKIIYGAEINGDILRSQDAGLSWRIVKRFGLGLREIAVDPQTNKIYVASYEKGLFSSVDGAENWTDLSADFAKYSNSEKYNRLVFNSAKKDSLFWVSKYGILRSDDAGKTWQDLKLLTPPGGVNIYAFAVNPQNDKEIYYTGTILDSKNQNLKSTFYRTSDGGTNWVTKRLPTNTVPVNMFVHTKNSSMIFLGFTMLEEGQSKNSAGQYGI